MLVHTELLFFSETNKDVSLPASAENPEELISAFSDILGCEPENSLFFDIETTGLSAANSMVFLIGAVYFDGKNLQLKQLLAQNEADESCILKEFFDLAKKYQTLIHFNGTTFDIPYVKERAVHHGLSHSLEEMNSIDLYQRFRSLKKLLNLPRMNQQTLEQFLKWPRQDQLTGKHMISLFKKYAVSGEKLVADLLLLHNHDDLVGMTHLLRFGSYLMLLNGSFSSVSARVEKSAALATHISSNPHTSLLELEFQLEKALPAPFSFPTDRPAAAHSTTSTAPALQANSAALSDTAALAESKALTASAIFASSASSIDTGTSSITLTINGSHGKLTVPFYQGELKYFFPDYRNYYYLPLEDQAIHKSIGAYVDAEHRENAKPANCYTRKTGTFLPQPEPIFQPVFTHCYKGKELYFEYTEKLLNSEDSLHMYAKALLQHLLK